MSTWVAPWWMGITADHVYENCPARQRGVPELQRVGWDRIGSGEINIDGTDVCGICVRWWRARNKAVA